MNKYVIISPVRNEEDYIKLTIESVINQTVKPVQWILVNDGSTDKTEEIIKGYLSKNTWMKLINLTDRGYYFPGTGVVNVFYKGYEQIDVKDWEYVVKLDVYLEFDPTYFENLLKKFTDNPQLGIASGGCLLPLKGKWVVENVQEDHPVGPSKVYKRECWEKMGGLRPGRDEGSFRR